MLIDLSEKYNHRGEYVVRKVEDEYLVIPLNNETVELDAAYTMSETGAFIFNLLDGNHTVNEIIELVLEEFDVPRKQAENDVVEFITRISNRFLI